MSKNPTSAKSTRARLQSEERGGFKSLDRSRVFEEICDQIRGRLASGSLRPGDKLPSEMELASEFNVSRPAVREALRTLEISGIVSIRKGARGGAFIRKGSPAMVSQSLHDLTILGHLSMEELAEARVEMHRVTVRLATQRGTDEDFSALEACIDRIESCTTADQFRERGEASLSFFMQIARATRNEAMVVFTESLNEVARVTVHEPQITLIPGLIEVRRKLVKSMRARKSDQAVELMTLLLDTIYVKAVLDKGKSTLRRPKTD